MGGQIDLADEGAGRLDVGYTGELELLDQSALQRPDRPLRASARQRASGRTRLSTGYCYDPRYFLQVKLESGLKDGLDDEAIEVHGRADHCGSA